MALTDQQRTDVRYYMGYSVAGDPDASPYRELAYSNVSYMGLSLDYRLDNLTASEEARITGFFLPNLTLRESEIQGAAANLDTDRAAVWTRNRDEVADRTHLFTQLRRDLCGFLGFPAGSALSRANRLVRA